MTTLNFIHEENPRGKIDILMIDEHEKSLVAVYLPDSSEVIMVKYNPDGYSDGGIKREYANDVEMAKSLVKFNCMKAELNRDGLSFADIST